jgi:hypothetical protein
MAILSKDKMRPGIEIDLTGPQGNAYYLLGLAQSLSKQIGWSESEREQLKIDMTSSDYENLLSVFDKHFGLFVTLYR